jgi:hypothetical protein
MFGLFSKNSDSDLMHHAKDVKRWRKEHEALKKQAGRIVEDYKKGETERAREDLKKLETLALQHLMSEDIRFYEMKKAVEAEQKDTPENRAILAAMQEFEESFRGTKQVLIKFFSHYKKPDVPLDAQFEEDFGGIVNAVVARIEFEESTLYGMMDK